MTWWIPLSPVMRNPAGLLDGSGQCLVSITDDPSAAKPAVEANPSRASHRANLRRLAQSRDRIGTPASAGCRPRRFRVPSRPNGTRANERRDARCSLTCVWSRRSELSTRACRRRSRTRSRIRGSCLEWVECPPLCRRDSVSAGTAIRQRRPYCQV